MGLLHRLLYQNDDLDAIDTQEYTQMLCRQVWSSHAADVKHLALDVEAQRVTIDLDTALPFGLIINEAITNALKHAFNERQRGTVTVTVSANPRDVSLTVSDDGRGMPECAAPEEGIGVKMISLLAKQLDGSAEFRSDEGTHVHVRFPLRGKGGSR
jgi:two-component sensor histidine kinase